MGGGIRGKLIAMKQAWAQSRRLIAHAHDGVPLSRDHGGPVRAIIPRWYFWKSAKWLVSIKILAVDKPGFWEVRGYHNDGDPWTEQRYN